MLHLITGQPGNGKTTLAVTLILDAIKAGRETYADIAGLDVPGVKPAPDDWRDTPHGSLIVYDEAQRRFPATAATGVTKDAKVRAMETHRHSGHDLILITQDPALIDHHLRKLVGRHDHLHRALGLQAATRFTWDRAVSSPMSLTEQKTADTSRFSLKGEARGKFQSATIHTHKFRLPRKVLWFAVGIAICGAFFAYGAFGRDRAFSAFRGGEASGVAAHAAGGGGGTARRPLVERPGEEWKTAATLPALSGCAVLSDSCRVWDRSGAQLDLSQAECLNVCSRPLALDFTEERKAEEMRKQRQSPVPQVAQADEVTGPDPVLGESWSKPLVIPGAIPSGPLPVVAARPR